jgi:hypothetical protein
MGFPIYETDSVPALKDGDIEYGHRQVRIPCVIVPLPEVESVTKEEMEARMSEEMSRFVRGEPMLPCDDGFRITPGTIQFMKRHPEVIPAIVEGFCNAVLRSGNQIVIGRPMKEEIEKARQYIYDEFGVDFEVWT